MDYLKNLIVVISIAVIGNVAFANSLFGQGKDPKIMAATGLLLEHSPRHILHSQNEDFEFPPGQFSLLLTLIVVHEILSTGNLKLSDKFFIDPQRYKPKDIGDLRLVETINDKGYASVSDLIQSIIQTSNRIAAIAFAEGIAGSQLAFSDLMSEYAKKIGIKHWFYVSPTGDNHPNEKTTARNIALLTSYLIDKFPSLSKKLSRTTLSNEVETINGGPAGHDKIQIDFLRTVFDERYGHSVIASSRHGERRLISVIAGAKSALKAKEEAFQLMERGFQQYELKTIAEAGQIKEYAMVGRAGSRLYFPVTNYKQIRLPFKRTHVPLLTSGKLIQEKLANAPIRKGQRVAIFRIIDDNENISDTTLYATESVEADLSWIFQNPEFLLLKPNPFDLFVIFIIFLLIPMMALLCPLRLLSSSITKAAINTTALLMLASMLIALGSYSDISPIESLVIIWALFSIRARLETRVRKSDFSWSALRGLAIFRRVVFALAVTTFAYVAILSPLCLVSYHYDKATEFTSHKNYSHLLPVFVKAGSWLSPVDWSIPTKRMGSM